MFHQFDVDEVWQMFGMSRGQASLRIMRFISKLAIIVVGIIHRVRRQARGSDFVVMFPPTEAFDFWEYGYAIPDPHDRDAWAAFNTCDAMAHYMFDHLRVDAVMGWRTRSLTTSRRMRSCARLGYSALRQLGRSTVIMYTFYRLDQAGWAWRRARLERREAAKPSGLGDTFLTLQRATLRAEFRCPRSNRTDFRQAPARRLVTLKSSV